MANLAAAALALLALRGAAERRASDHPHVKSGALLQEERFGGEGVDRQVIAEGLPDLVKGTRDTSNREVIQRLLKLTSESRHLWPLALQHLGHQLKRRSWLGRAGGATGAAARSRCRTSNARLKLTVRNPSTVQYGLRRASRRGDARRLRVSCRATRNGLTVSVRTRSRRTKLRSVVGKRLRIGLYRSPKATGDGELRATFRR